MTRERLDPDVTGGGSKLNNNVMYLLLFGMGGFGPVSGRLGQPRSSVHVSAWRQALLGWLLYNPVITVPLAHHWAGNWALAVVPSDVGQAARTLMGGL
jgi:hypothetical protein